MSSYYKAFCTIAQEWIYTWADSPPTVCPNSAHTGPNSIDPNSVTFIRKKVFKVVIVAKNNDGDYSSLAEALANEPDPDTVFNIYPGTYYEMNPMFVNVGVTITSVGSPGNTRIVALNPFADIFKITPWVKINGLFMLNAYGPGSRAVYLDGSLSGSSAFSSIENCIIQGCDIGLETDKGPDTLLAIRMLIVPMFAPTSRGVYCHNGGQFTGLNIMVLGLPAPYSIPVSRAFECSDPGSKISLTTSTVNDCIDGFTINNDGNVECTLINLYHCHRGLVIGPDGTNSRLRASSLHIDDSVNYDLDILATDGDIELGGGELDQNKVNNPNKIKLNAKFYSFTDSNKFQTITGELRIGSINDPTILSVGEGRYDTNQLVVFSNSSYEDGDWINNTIGAISTEQPAFSMFQGTSVGNCCYVGFINNIYGFKINVNIPTLLKTSKNDIIIEYWDGNDWVYVSNMQTFSAEPYYICNESFVSYKRKIHIRLGITLNTLMPEKILFGVSKKWIRLRIVNELSSIPHVEYIKIHTSNSCIGKDGFIEYYGNGRVVAQLPITLDNMTSMTPIHDAQINLCKYIGIKRKNNCFGKGVLSQLSYVGYFPKNLDVSFPFKLKLSFVGNSELSGSIEFRLKMGYSKENSHIYINDSDAPEIFNDQLAISKVVNMDTNNNNKEKRIDIKLDINKLNVNPDTNNPFMIWMILERDSAESNANDTYAGDVILIQATGFGIIWNNGGHILSY